MQLLSLCVVFMIGNFGNTLRLPSTDRLLQSLEQRLDAKISNIDDQIFNLKEQIKLENKQLRTDISLIFENLIDFEDKIRQLLTGQSISDKQDVGKIDNKSNDDSRNNDDRFKRMDARMDGFETAFKEENGLKDEVIYRMKNINTAVSLMSDDIGEIRDNLKLMKQIEGRVEELIVCHESEKHNITEIINTLKSVEHMTNASLKIKETLKSVQRVTGVNAGNLEEMKALLTRSVQTVDEVQTETAGIKSEIVTIGHVVHTFGERLHNYSEEVGQLNEQCYELIAESGSHLGSKLDDTSHAVKQLTNLSSGNSKELKEILNQCLALEDLERSGNLKLENHLSIMLSFLNETINTSLKTPVNVKSQATSPSQATTSTPDASTIYQLITSLETTSTPEQTTSEVVHRSCRDGVTRSGVYEMTLPGYPVFEVYCDMDTDGGGWLVFQRRKDGSVDFYRNWEEYKHGFGNLSGEFWLGNDIISKLTSTPQELRIDLWDWDGATRYAEYKTFSLGPESDQYRLRVSGYSGNAGDSLNYGNYYNNQGFSTKDRDNDHASNDCAKLAQSAWWFRNCGYSSLNGYYYPQARFTGNRHRGLLWKHWRGWNYSLKRSEMKIRPT